MAKKKQGFQPIGQKQIDALVKLVEKASEPFAASRLDTSTRRRIVKMRKGGAAAIPTIVAICERRGVTVPGVSFDDLSSKATYAARLQELERAASIFVRNLRDELLTVQSEAWTGTAAAYAMLNGAARSQSDIVLELAGVRSFFAVRRGKKAAATTTNEPSTSATTAKGTPAATA